MTAGLAVRCLISMAGLPIYRSPNFLLYARGLTKRWNMSMYSDAEDQYLEDIARRAVKAAKLDECETHEAEQDAKERAHRFAQEEIKILRIEHLRDRLEEIIIDVIKETPRMSAR